MNQTLSMDLRLSDLANWFPQARAVGNPDLKIQRVHTDTRSIQPGDLFVALRGEHFDAHQFLGQLPASGVTAAIAEHGLEQARLSGLEVDNTRQALGQLAKAWRSQFDLPLIAVTGSNGKTTVTQMIASILRAAHGDLSWATQGNLNNEIGLPLTLLGLRRQHRCAVVEIGMNHPGEIQQLAKIAAPTIGLVNNAQREHQEFMSTVEAVARENGQILSALPQNGVAVFPSDEAYSDLWRSLSPCHKLCFGEDTNADVRLADQTQPANWVEDHWRVTIQTAKGEIHPKLHIAGRHNLRNALAATAAAMAAGISLAAIEQGLSSFRPVSGRSRALKMQIQIGSGQSHTLTVIDDTYNANPDSVRAAIDVLAELPAPALLVLGDMGEVGAQGSAFHEEVGRYAVERKIQWLFALGSLSRHSADMMPSAQHFENIDQLNQAIFKCLPQIGSILVKGSRFMKMERVVQFLSAHQISKEAQTCC